MDLNIEYLSTLATSLDFTKVAVTSLALALYYFILYPLFFSPLADVPGPKAAALSSHYIDSRFSADTAILHVQKLLHKYGPIVRIGPKEIVINDANHLVSLYGVRSTFPKPKWASLFKNYDTDCAFSTRHRDEHRQRRRLVSKIYTMTGLLKNTQLLACVQNRLDKTTEIIKAERGGPVDIYSLSVKFALDNVTYLVYGESFDLMGGKNAEIAHIIRKIAVSAVRLVRSPLYITIMSLPPFCFFIPEWLSKAVTSRDILATKNLAIVKKILQNRGKLDPNATTVGCYQSQEGYPKALTDLHIASECLDHVVAGGDTTGASITYFLYTLALPENKRYQDQIRQVLNLTNPRDFKDISTLPFLGACVQETLRVYAPGPGALQQRVTPAGEVTVLTVQRKSYKLPSETQIGFQAYSHHRLEEIFGANPEGFRPERWLEAGEGQLQKMHHSLIPFGTGARVCIGMNLAYLEIKAIVAQLLRDFVISLPPNHDPRTMQPIFGAVIRPVGEKCDLIFTSIS